jgi:hypothetical protein
VEVVRAIFVLDVVEEPGLEEHELLEAEVVDGEVGMDGL